MRLAYAFHVDLPSGNASVAPFVPDQPPEIDDAALVAAIVGCADRQAFATLFRRHAPRVKAHLLARGVSSALADELTQDVMLRLWRKAAQFDASKGSIGAWLYAITRNTLLNHVRRRPRPEAATDDPTADQPAVLPADDALIAREEQRTLARSLNVLPPEQREILHRAYWRGQTLQECADEKQLPLGTVKTRVRLALARLRAILCERSDEG
jgi:RNA polymerase sigma-70 factor (ECF subfamily)